MTHPTTAVAPTRADVDELEATIASWRRSLMAAGKSKLTVRSYIDGVTQFRKYLESQGMPLTIRGIKREHIESWLIDLRETHQASTRAARHQILVQDVKFLVREDEITRSPMEKIEPPKHNPKPVPVISENDFDQLLDACSGRDFASVRDRTILMMLMETGLRRAEIATIDLADLDLDGCKVRVTGKRNKQRDAGFSNQLATQLDRYLRARRTYLAFHRRENTDQLWIGEGGRTFTHFGIEHAVRRRATQAGLVDDHGRPKLHPHMFRHSATHYLLTSGMDPAAVQAQMGWDTPEMLARYGASMAAARAHAGYEKHSPLGQMKARK
jgi:integrase/recombinase XerC